MTLLERQLEANPYELLAQGYELDAKLARQHGRFDDARLLEEAARSTRAGTYNLFRVSTFRGLESNRSESVTPRAPAYPPGQSGADVTDSLGSESTEGD